MPSPQTNHTSKSVLALTEASLSRVFSNLSLRDLTACRTTCTKFASIIENDYPQASPGQVFIRVPGDLKARKVSAFQPKDSLRWTCTECHSSNYVVKVTCRRCGRCRAGRDGVRRIFIGQLRKDLTVEAVDWILRTLLPDINVFHIEGHTSKEGRGKGCAWVYVTNPRDESRLLSLNRRVFLDVDAFLVEGIHVVSHRLIDRLEAFAQTRSTNRNRPQVLPRQPLVIERPAGTADAEELQTTMSKTTLQDNLAVLEEKKKRAQQDNDIEMVNNYAKLIHSHEVRLEAIANGVITESSPEGRRKRNGDTPVATSNGNRRTPGSNGNGSHQRGPSKRPGVPTSPANAPMAVDPMYNPYQQQHHMSQGHAHYLSDPHAMHQAGWYAPMPYYSYSYYSPWPGSASMVSPSPFAMNDSRPHLHHQQLMQQQQQQPTQSMMYQYAPADDHRASSGNRDSPSSGDNSNDAPPQKAAPGTNSSSNGQSSSNGNTSGSGSGNDSNSGDKPRNQTPNRGTHRHGHRTDGEHRRTGRSSSGTRSGNATTSTAIDTKRTELQDAAFAAWSAGVDAAAAAARTNRR